MQGKLQELTEKLYAEGVAKANDEAGRIAAEARQKADSIIAAARAEANSIKSQAEREVADLKRNVESELKMAAQQAVSALKDRISRLVTAGIADAPVGQAMSDVEFVKQLITAIVGNAGSDLASIRLELPGSMEGKVQDFLKSGSLAKLGKGLDVVFDRNLSGGFRVGPADQGFVVSFTDEGFAEFFREYLRPRTRQFLYGDEG